MPTEPDSDEDKEDDAPVIINYIKAEAEPLCAEQLTDPNLICRYELKRKAEPDNQLTTVIESFNNREQQAYYKQWSRTIILNAWHGL